MSVVLAPSKNSKYGTAWRNFRRRINEESKLVDVWRTCSMLRTHLQKSYRSGTRVPKRPIGSPDQQRVHSQHRAQVGLLASHEIWVYLLNSPESGFLFLILRLSDLHRHQPIDIVTITPATILAHYGRPAAKRSGSPISMSLSPPMTSQIRAPIPAVAPKNSVE